jgi:hypothetical protein
MHTVEVPDGHHRPSRVPSRERLRPCPDEVHRTVLAGTDHHEQLTRAGDRGRPRGVESIPSRSGRFPVTRARCRPTSSMSTTSAARRIASSGVSIAVRARPGPPRAPRASPPHRRRTARWRDDAARRACHRRRAPHRGRARCCARRCPPSMRRGTRPPPAPPARSVEHDALDVHAAAGRSTTSPSRARVCSRSPSIADGGDHRRDLLEVPVEGPERPADRVLDEVGGRHRREHLTVEVIGGGRDAEPCDRRVGLGPRLQGAHELRRPPEAEHQDAGRSRVEGPGVPDAPRPGHPPDRSTTSCDVMPDGLSTTRTPSGPPSLTTRPPRRRRRRRPPGGSRGGRRGAVARPSPPARRPGPVGTAARV